MEKEPISKLRVELGLQPTVFFRWQKEFSENGTTKLLSRQERIAYLEKKIQTKDEFSCGADGRACGPPKRKLGTLAGVLVLHDTLDQIVDLVRRWLEKTEIGASRRICWR